MCIRDRLGVQAKPLNGAQRLKLMHDMFNMDGASKFQFDWKDLVKSGLSVKDAIEMCIRDSMRTA